MQPTLCVSHENFIFVLAAKDFMDLAAVLLRCSEVSVHWLYETVDGRLSFICSL